MKRIFAAVATVWAVLGVSAALAWTNAQHATPAAPAPVSAAATTRGTALSTPATTPVHATTRSS